MLTHATQKSDPRPMPLRPLYLFSRRDGLLTMKLSNACDTKKIISIDDPSWLENHAYTKPGASASVLLCQ
jgi:hypothetical protein